LVVRTIMRTKHAASTRPTGGLLASPRRAQRPRLSGVVTAGVVAIVGEKHETGNARRGEVWSGS